MQQMFLSLKLNGTIYINMLLPFATPLSARPRSLSLSVLDAEQDWRNTSR